MSDLSRFLKQNQKQKENVWYAPTASLTDENGEALKWEFRAIGTAESEDIRDGCMVDVVGKGKNKQNSQKLNAKSYIAKLISRCVVYPDLREVELQNSYGVMSDEELLKAMVNHPGEYAKLSMFVQKLCGFDELESDVVAEAKN